MGVGVEPGGQARHIRRRWRQAELEQQQKSETIRTWTPQSLVVEETTVSFNGRYEVGPILPVLNIAITSVAFSFPPA